METRFRCSGSPQFQRSLAVGGSAKGGIGIRLRRIRMEWGLSLREIEQRSLQLAQQAGDSAFQISASWLARLEREDHELTAAKLVALAAIYNLSYEEVLGHRWPENATPIKQDQLKRPNSTLLLNAGRLEEQARSVLPDPLTSDPPPEETSLLPPITSSASAPYRHAIIGRHDRGLDPMIKAGSLVKIHTQKRAIAQRRDWTHEFDRPIYMLLTHTRYLCGWCELDRESAWLTLIPHPLSHASSQRWRYKKEVEVVGRVVAVYMPLVSPE